MTKMFIDENGRAVPLFRALSTETVAYTGTAGTSAVLDARVSVVRIWCTTDAVVLVGSGITADINDMPITAKVETYIPINEGDVVSAIQLSTGGDMHVTGLL